MTEATTTPTPFTWASGPESVQVSGSWDNWTEKIALDKLADGSFRKQIPLPSDTKVHYKFIVDGNWTTSQSEPTADDGGNVNNIVDVGPAPTPVQAVAAQATEIGAGIAAGVVGAAAAASAAAYSFADSVNGTNTATAENTEHAAPAEEKKVLSETEKKADPAAAIRETADEDIRNSVPTSVTNASHAAMPVIASAVATVTGADIFRGNAEALPVSQKEINETQAQANKGDNAFLASRIEPQGGAISDPAAATTENAKAAASVANNATIGAPVVPVTENGFAANITAQSGGLTTAADKGTEGGAKAAAVAAGSAGAIGAAGVGGVAAASAAKKEETVVKPSPVEKKEEAIVKPPPAEKKEEAIVKTPPAEKKEEAIVKPPPAEKKEEAIIMPAGATKKSEPVAKSSDLKGAASSSDAPKKLPTTGPAPSKAAADKANAPAAASSGPLASGKETTTPAAAPTVGKALPGTPTKKPVTSSPVNKNETRSHSRGASAASKSQASTHTAMASEASSSPSTPDKKKRGLFGKIKQALSPATSPNGK